MRFILSYLMVFSFSSLFAQDGSVDSSFGDNGVQLQEFDCNHMFLNSVLELDNGAIFMSGVWYIDEYTSFLMQINEDGEPVPSYGNNGFLELPDTFEIITIEKQLSNNQFLIFGENSEINDNVNALYKINDQGNIDLSYGIDGALIPAPDNILKTKHLVLDDGSVFIATYNNASIVIKKYTNNGLLDPSFTEIGVSLSNDLQIDSLFDFKISANGNYHIGLLQEINEEITHIIYRINNEGLLDKTFGNGGAVQLPEPDFTNIPHAIDINVLQNNQVVVSRSNSQWWGDGNEPTETKIYKLNTNGSINNNFGDVGVLTINNYRGFIREQQNGRLLYFGILSDFEGGLDVLMKRYNQQGNLDSSFDFQNNFGGFGSVFLLNHSNEKIYFLGTKVWYSPPMNFIALRYNNSPLGLEENDIHPISISPNPSNDIFNIHLTVSTAEGYPYAVYDLKGALLMQGIFQKQSAKVDLSLFEDGIYLLKVNNSTLKLVKK